METYFLGIDVSKGYADFLLPDKTGKTVVPSFKLDDTTLGHYLLFQVLSDFFDAHPETIVKAAVESTGGYEDNWYNTIKQFSAHLPIKVARINPVGIQHHSKAAMKRTTTDRVAAQSIAEYQIHHDQRVQYNADDSMKSLRRFWSAVQIQIKARTQFLNEMETLLYTANPGLLCSSKETIPLSGCSKC